MVFGAVKKLSNHFEKKTLKRKCQEIYRDKMLAGVKISEAKPKNYS